MSHDKNRPAWRSLEELRGAPEFGDKRGYEFEDGASEPHGVSRRSFLTLMGASLGLAGLSGCRRPEEKILPYGRAPEEVVPGKPLVYATAMPFAGTALGLLVESHEGRPTKIEGNPQHPESLGAANAFAQASVLDLYDPDRSTGPREGTTRRTPDDAARMLRDAGTALRANGGRGLAVLTEGHRSPTLQAALDELRRALPGARVVRYEPFSRQNAREGARLAFGRPLEMVADLKSADVIVALDADLFFAESSPVRLAHEWSARRRVEKPADSMNRLYCVESAFTVTGASADHRLRIRRSEVPAFAVALAKELDARGVLEAPLAGAVRALAPAAAKASEAQARWVKALAADLAQHRGRCVLVAGDAQPAPVHALVQLLNLSLGARGATARWVQPFDAASDGPDALAGLAEALDRGEIETLLLLGGNPVFTAPADVDFAAAMGRAKTTIHLSTHFDETSAAAGWHLNRAHFLESWSDVRTLDGTASVVQPLIAPLFAGRTDAEVVRLVLGQDRRAHELVREQWLSKMPDGEKGWRRALHEGVVAGSAFPEEAVQPRAEALAALAGLKPADGLEVTFHPDAHVWDGRWANNAWLHELPDPMTKLAWGNAALVSPHTAERLKLADGAVVEIAAGGRGARVPVIVAPGQADDSIALAWGQGRKDPGRVGRGTGFDVRALRNAAGASFVAAAAVQGTGATHALARTQDHHAMEGRPLVREATLAQFRHEPEFARHAVHHLPLVSLYADHPYEGQRWGMAIDLGACTGCNACVVACQAENNIPVVGRDGVLRSREMHWLRVDRYFVGAGAEPQAVMQPVACQHCENAPCENVCPVAATTHSHEGLNDMAYNRCVGTRYCANNCPYKVRRFNFFNYQKNEPEQGELRKMQRNPDVTVRSRGVMEKCSYCVQRIQEAKIGARADGRDKVPDGAIVPACQQTCPTQAIVFGDLNDPRSLVSRRAANPRGYALLGELNVRPRTSYLAVVRNPNPELEGA